MSGKERQQADVGHMQFSGRGDQAFRPRPRQPCRSSTVRGSTPIHASLAYPVPTTSPPTSRFHQPHDNRQLFPSFGLVLFFLLFVKVTPLFARISNSLSPLQTQPPSSFSLALASKAKFRNCFAQSAAAYLKRNNHNAAQLKQYPLPDGLHTRHTSHPAFGLTERTK